MIEYENLKKVNEKLFNEYSQFFQDFLNSGWYILGKNVSSFERNFAEFCNTKYSIGVASGLDALILAINSFNFPKDSEIIVPANTYIATILAIIRNDCIPILVEPHIDTYNINTDKIEEKISKKTKAILVVHLYGKSCNMDPIISLADYYKLEIIEDCAQAHGAKYKNQLVGSFGTGCFSFYPTKNLGALGDAGAITTNNKDQLEKITALRNYGSLKKYYNDYIGYNSRLDELQAGFLNIKLNVIEEITEHKRNLADIYLKNLDEKIIKPQVNPLYYDVYHIFNIRHKKRDNLKEYLYKHNIKTEIHYPIPPHKQKALRSYFNSSFPISEEIHSTTLSLPISYSHNEDDIYKVIDLINKWINYND